MGSQVQQALRTLCFNTQWKYAVFWKLQLRTRMMLTCEDAYYRNNELVQKKWSSDAMIDFQDGHYSNDPVGLAVAKMSYHVYSLGEGIVGQVVVTGKHLWISADEYAMDPGSSFEYCDGLQTQFSAGIKTIAVVAVVPHGVVQLGSLDRIAEDPRMVNHIRSILYDIQDSIVGSPPIVIKNGTESSCLSGMSTRTSNSENKSAHSPHAITQEGKYISSCTHSGKPGDQSYLYFLPNGNSNTKVRIIDKDQRPDNSKIASGISGHFSEPELQNQELSSIFTTKFEGKSGSFGEFGGVLDSGDNLGGAQTSSYHALSASDYSGMDMSYFSPEILHLAASVDQNGSLSAPELSSMYLPKDSEKLELQCTLDNMGSLHMPTRFCGGNELYEVLGPAFQKRSNHYDLDAALTDTRTIVELPEGPCTSSREHLLEAVVAEVNHKDTDTNWEMLCQIEPPLTIMNTAEPCLSDVDTISSVGYSFDQSLNSSGAYSSWSSKGVSPASSSKDSGLLKRPQEPTKVQKKRARPGESSRPRPRDRQLIQDRIRELRELVPNGSKCSIDSLLERTIKHTLFMQSVTNHADKLKKCTTSKLLDKEMGSEVYSCAEQGSSWAVEVGSNLKVFPIIVENINMNGQVLVEMLCDGSSRFLEVAEAIRSLGLTILKGETETSGEKTWMRFVVEGPDNRKIHRMDILWSLMQLLQPKKNS